MSRMTPAQERMRRLLWFLIRLTALSAPLYAVLLLDISLEPLQSSVAFSSEHLLRAAGFAVERDGLLLRVGGSEPFAFAISPDCTGWKSMLIFAALVLAALGASPAKRLAGLAIGVPLVYLANVLRIFAVVSIERSMGIDAAMLFHDWLWQAGMMAVVLALWLGWLGWERISLRARALIGRPAGARGPAQKYNQGRRRNYHAR